MKEILLCQPKEKSILVIYLHRKVIQFCFFFLNKYTRSLGSSKISQNNLSNIYIIFNGYMDENGLIYIIFM